MAIVVSHIAADFDTLAARALRQVPLSDLVELRLDRVGHPGEAQLKRFMAECEKPVIVTVHGSEAFGDFEGSLDERCEILHAAARAGASFVDIDWTLAGELGMIMPPCHRILSRHDVQGTPKDLERFDSEVREWKDESDIIKIVTHAQSTEDGLRMLQWLRQAPGGTVAFCSGTAGSFTRLLAPILGSPFTYAAPADRAHSPGTELTAPGQLRVDELLGLMPPGGLTPTTAIFAVVGKPIAHSLSPRLHGMALKAAHLDAVYVAFEPDDFGAFFELLKDENFRGLSITAPFKSDALAVAGYSEEAAERLGAANTLVRDKDRWRASNTDVSAIRETLERAFELHRRRGLQPEKMSACRALVLGAGGAARAVLEVLRECGAPVSVAARDPQRAQVLLANFGRGGEDLPGWEALDWDGIADCPYDLLINCTPVGTEGLGGCPIPLDSIRSNSIVLDCVYRPIRTELLMAATAKGCTAVPGGEWFLRQATQQFNLFTNTEADEDLMRATLEMALGADGVGADGVQNSGARTDS